MKKTRIGIVGCGAISGVYWDAARIFDMLEIVGCADLDMAAAQAKARQYGCQASSVGELLARDDIDIVLNLTVPQAHAEIAVRALEAGKHVYTEKPLAVTLEDGRRVLETARSKNLRVGYAPDTVLGGAMQTCRKLIDDGLIGRPIAGTAFMMVPGREHTHPNPAFHYQPGGGPMFDMGPYYLSALITFLGPARRVCASTAMTYRERTCTTPARRGETLPVNVTTHLAGTIDFVNGAVVTLVMSLDVWGHKHSPLEIYGTEGSLVTSDPNNFGGAIYTLSVREGGTDWRLRELTHGYAVSHRGLGVADMARAIRGGRPHRCNAELAYHVLEIMRAFDESSVAGNHVQLKSGCDRPAPMPQGLRDGELD